jgi:hypothetical protein
LSKSHYEAEQRFLYSYREYETKDKKDVDVEDAMLAGGDYGEINAIVFSNQQIRELPMVV